MTNFEKGIKTFAIVLAIILCVGVLGGIISVLGGVAKGIHHGAEAVSEAADAASAALLKPAAQADAHFQNNVAGRLSGTSEYYFSTAEVKELSIENGIGEMIIAETDNEKIHVTIGNTSEICSVSMSGSTLEIENVGTEVEVFGIHIGERVEGAADGIVVEIPRDFRFEEVSIENGIGTMEVNGLRADEIAIESGTGSLKCIDIDANDIDVESGVGQVEIGFLGPMNAYDMRLDPGVGNIYVNGIKQNRINHTNKEAEKSIRISSAIGAVYVNFSDN